MAEFEHVAVLSGGVKLTQAQYTELMVNGRVDLGDRTLTTQPRSDQEFYGDSFADILK